MVVNIGEKPSKKINSAEDYVSLFTKTKKLHSGDCGVSLTWTKPRLVNVWNKR